MASPMHSPVSSPICQPRFGTERDFSRQTYGARAREIAKALGFTLMPWQEHVLDVALEVDESGRLVYRRVLLTVPRQSGKTTLILVLFALRALGFSTPQVMSYAAQTGVDARKKFVDEHVPLLNASPLSPLFRVRMTNGHEAILWKNGSRHHISAGTEKSGHGATLDLAVVDEAFAQPDGRLEQAFSPAMLTRPEPQLWFVSTAGAPSDIWFRQKVEAGRQAIGEDGICYFEWSADADEDPADRTVWRRCMPALGHTVREATIAAEFLSMPEDEFRRAYLNQWVDKKRDAAAFDADVWGSLADPTTDPPGTKGAGSPVFAVATAPDRSWTAIAAAWKRADGNSHVILDDYREGTAWVAQRIAELRSRWGGAVSTDEASRSLVPDATHLSRSVQAQAHNALADAVTARTIRHGNEKALNLSAVRFSRWKPSGDTRVLDRKGDADISPLIAAALALQGVTSATSSDGWVMAL